jgi:uroporphyrinogen decarboxylase
VKLNAADYFDLDRYYARIERNRRVWREFWSGHPGPQALSGSFHRDLPGTCVRGRCGRGLWGRESLAFIPLCAPALCDMFGVAYDDYYTDLATMADTQLRGIAWRLANLDEDDLPEAVFLDQATLHEAIAFNLPVHYRDISPPWGGRFIEDPESIDRLPAPSLVDVRGLNQTQHRLEQLRELVAGLPVLASVHLHAPFTLAAQLMGAQELYVLCLEEPQRAHRLLKFCVSFFRAFERAKWQYGISPEVMDEFVCWREAQAGLSRVWASDDTAAAVSPEFYREFVLPYNQDLFAGFEHVHLHMDGQWDHLLPLVAAQQPDFVEVGGETGWNAAVEILGPRSVIQGGISGTLAVNGTAAECAKAARLALEAAAGRARAVITIAQEPHPGTPPENMQAILDSARAWQAERRVVIGA